MRHAKIEFVAGEAVGADCRAQVDFNFFINAIVLINGVHRTASGLIGAPGSSQRRHGVVVRRSAQMVVPKARPGVVWTLPQLRPLAPPLSHIPPWEMGFSVAGNEVE